MRSPTSTALLLLLCYSPLVFSTQGEHEREFLIPKFVKHVEKERERKEAIQQRLNGFYDNPMRLPSTLKANHYDIWLKPYYPAPGITYDPSRNFTFDGDVTMQVTVTASTSVFVVNANRLNFSSVTIKDSQNNDVGVASTNFNDTSEQFTITPSGPINAGQNYTINFKYTGLLNAYYTAGFFYTYYIDVDGYYHWMVATQMEPFDARAVFPGLDEPAYKATFSVSMTYPSSHVALGNMPDTQITASEDGWSTVTFDTTPIMSTYLVAVAAGPFVSANYTNDAGTLARSWGWTGQEQYLQFAAEVSGKCLYQFGVYVNYTYPLPKSDNLGLPQFPAGAMENWGLVIYAYSYLVYNPQAMTTDDMESVIVVICHELAHQWFGDLVTMAWWDQLFLNEGFAAYFESFIQTKLYPEQFDYIDANVIRFDVQGAMRFDVSTGAHPLIYDNGPAFDTITYNKGASMLRMINDVMGESVMREGLQNYVQRFQYSNAQHLDLFDEFDKVSQKYQIKDWCGNTLNVTHFLEPYFHQTNVPLIMYQNAGFNMKPTTIQSPWKNISTLPPSEFGYEWDVPLRTGYYYLRGGNTTLDWNTESGDSCDSVSDSRHFEHPKSRQIQWAVPSVTAATYARLRYDDVGFSRMLYAIRNENNIPSSVKVALLGDEMAYVSDQKSKQLPYSYDRYLSLVKNIFSSNQFINNPNGPLFQMIQDNLDYFGSLFRDGTDHHLMHLFFYEIFGDVYRNLNWTSSSLWGTNIFMESFLPYAVRYGIHDVANRTLSMYDDIKTACVTSTNGTSWCNPYPPDLRRAIYCGATLYASDAIDYFGNILAHYNQEVTYNHYFYMEYYALLEGLSCTQKPQDLRTLIRFFINSPFNSNMIFGWLKSNPVASDALYNYMIENPDKVINYSGFSAYLDAMTYNWYTNNRLGQFLYLQNFNYSQSQQTIINKYQSRLQQNILFLQTEFPPILRWFYNNLVQNGETPWRTRLDGNVVPLSYWLQVQPFIPTETANYFFYQNMTFIASSLMNFTVNKNTDTIAVNVHRLQILPNTVYLNDAFTEQDMLNGTLAQLSKDYTNGIMTIKFPVTLQPSGVYTLGFNNYVGFIFDSGDSSGAMGNWHYYEFNDKKGWIFATDMEMGPQLRSLVPCVDEPWAKASWTISLIHPTEMMALSNEADMGTVPIHTAGWSVTQFQTTPPMSSYLVAVVCGHFAYVSGVTNDHTLVRMVSWTGMEQYGDFGLPFAIGTINYMSKLLKIPMAMQKLDILSLPQYSGDVGKAMENWGLIIGEYTAFSIDPEYATTDQKSLVAWTIAHETIHQWFGDLVTPVWWDDFFLNEAFAQYFMWECVNFTDPNQSGYLSDYSRILRQQISVIWDCGSYTKPIRSVMGDLLSYTAYDKGPDLLWMLELVLGRDVYIEGLQDYLLLHSFGTATGYDLWQSLSTVASKYGIKGWDGQTLNVTVLMDEWSLKKSYPKIKLSQQNGLIAYTQSSCLDQTPQVLWKIPLWMQNAGSENMYWYTDVSGTDPAWSYAIPNSGFRVVNSRSIVPLRVQYDNASLYLIKQQLNNDFTQIPVQSRAGILFDARYYLDNGVYSWDDLLDLTMYMQKEDSFGPIDTIYNTWMELLNRFKYDKNFPVILSYLNAVTSNVMQYNQWAESDKKDWQKMQLSKAVTTISCQMGRSDCTDEAKRRFQGFLAACTDFTTGTGTCNPTYPDFRRLQYCYGIAADPENGAKNLTKHMDYFVTKKIYFDRDYDNMLHGLSCIQEMGMLRPYIDQAISGQLNTDLIYYIGWNNNDGMVLWNYLQSNFTSVVNSPYLFANYVENMVRNWSQDEQLKRLNDFLNDPNFNYLTDSDKSAWHNAISTVTANQAWLTKNSPAIVNWITNHIN